MTGYADFEQFVVARRDALLRTAYLLTGDHHDAEDLVQSALIKGVPKWARIKDRPEPYVRRVLARESVNRWRGRRWREVTTDVVPDATQDDQSGAEMSVPTKTAPGFKGDTDGGDVHGAFEVQLDSVNVDFVGACDRC